MSAASNIAPFPAGRLKPRAGLVLTGGGARAAYQVGVVKARVQPLGGTPADGSKFIRPAREALILRRLVARHQGRLPKAVIVRMWREMISALLQVEGPFVVAVQAPKGETALWDLARDHYGSRVRITPLPAGADVLNPNAAWNG